MDIKESPPESTVSLVPASTTTTIGTVVKEPDLVTILEDVPLTNEQIEEEQELLEEGRLSEDEPNEKTPLLRSTETFEKSGSSFFTHNSRSLTTSFTTSQASLFIPSIQFSLYSSFLSISRSLDQHSVAISLPEKSANISGSSTPQSRSTTLSLIEKLSLDGKASTILALWNMISMILSSSSLLAMPYAVALGGFAALFVLLLIGFLGDFTAVFLIECLYDVSPKSRIRKRVRSSYAEIAADAWGPVGGRVVDFIIVSLAYCTCILMIMVLGSSMRDLFQDLFSMTVQQWCLLCTLAVLPTVFIKQLSFLAWLSMLAVIAVIILVFIVVGFTIGESSLWTLHNIPPFDLNSFPVSLGIIMFSYCGHTVFAGIEGSMHNPKMYNKVAHGAFSAATTVKCLVGLFSCITFGVSTQSIVILNMSLSKKTILSSIATILVIINVYFSYPLNMFIVSGTVDLVLLPKLPVCYKSKKYHSVWVFISRTILVFTTLGVAIAVPHFGFLMSIIGSLLGVCVSFIFPCLLHLQLKWKQLKWHNIVFEFFIILFGTVSGILGFVYSSMALKNSV